MSASQIIIGYEPHRTRDMWNCQGNYPHKPPTHKNTQITKLFTKSPYAVIYDEGVYIS